MFLKWQRTRRTDRLQSVWPLICLFRPILLLLCLSFLSVCLLCTHKPWTLPQSGFRTSAPSAQETRTVSFAHHGDWSPLAPTQGCTSHSWSVFPAGLFQSGGYGSVEQQSIASCGSVVTSLWPCGHAVHQTNPQLSRQAHQDQFHQGEVFLIFLCGCEEKQPDIEPTQREE